MKDKELLAKYLPIGSVDLVMDWIISNNVHLKIAKRRNTKLGDYRPPSSKNPNQRISINHNLNSFAFLITFIHELAHLIVWEKHKNKVAPHGQEWKMEYRILMEPILKKNIFPNELIVVLNKSIINSKASSSSDLHLSRILKKYDPQTEDSNLEDLPINSIFQTETGIRFVKGEKRRTRFICVRVQDNKKYLFHPLTPVYKVVDLIQRKIINSE